MRKATTSLYLLAGLIGLSLVALFWLVFHAELERTKPEIKIQGLNNHLGISQTLTIRVFDAEAGLKKISVGLLQDGVTHNLLSRDLSGTKTADLELALTIEPGRLKLQEKEAVLLVSAADNSWWENTKHWKQPIWIDLTPPRLALLTPTNYLNPGGTGVIAYKASENLALSGVLINDDFTSAQPLAPDKQVMAVYFSVPPEAKQGVTKITIVAQDQAGNKVQTPLPHLIREKKFPADRMTLKDSFLQEKMPEFASRFPELKGKTAVEIFKYVNDRMRRDNFGQIREICANPSPAQKWQGTFLRLPNASPMAGFGERRTYLYEGGVIGESIHEGVDLASTINAPIPAANHGSVIFAGYLGIYGNTVILDHGLGLFSLYSHLNDITTKKGAEVKRGEIIGTSGTSGLAGGDHLHFAMLAGGRFVNPVEWWDPKWIADNVTGKLGGYLPTAAGR